MSGEQASAEKTFGIEAEKTVTSERVSLAIKASLLLTVYLTVTFGLATAALKPAWISTGKYAEYEVTGSAAKEKGVSFFRWEITQLFEDYAIVKISGLSPRGSIEEIETKMNWNGIQGIWLPLDALEELSGSIREKRLTLVGEFECLKITVTGPSVTATYWYESLTGVCVELGWDGGEIMNSQIRSTNIFGGAVGPQRNASSLFLVAELSAFAILGGLVLLAIYRRRRRSIQIK